MLKTLARALLSSLLLLAAPADAQLAQTGAGPSIPPWIYSGAFLDCNFATGRYYNCPVASDFTFTRSSAETGTWADGHLSYFTSGNPAITTLGWQIWEARTNDALYSSDLTQAGSWTATNITAAKNATGPDNVANSASTITAGAANSTILQAITLSSQADTYSVYVLCVTCTGNVQIAEYAGAGGASFTTLTASNCFNQIGVGTAPNSVTWVRCSAEATLLNPVIGFNIVNSGDSVEVFCNQLEPGAFASPCIPTTSGSASRAADLLTAAGSLASLFTSAQGSLLFGGTQGSITNAARLYADSNGTPNQLEAVASKFEHFGSVTLTASLGYGTNATYQVGYSWGAAGQSLAANAGTVVTSATLRTAGLNPTAIGTNPAANRPIDGYLARLTAWNYKLVDATLQGFTSQFSNIVGVGDSITSGVGMTTPWPLLLATDLETLQSNQGHSAIGWNYNSSGVLATPNTLLTLESTDVCPLVSSMTNRFGFPYIFLFAGTNDIVYGATAAQAYSSFQTYFAALLACGQPASKIVVVTMLPRTGLTTARNTYNADLIAGAATQGYLLARTDLDPNIGCAACNTNTTYYNVDAIHPNNLGEAIEIYIFCNAIGGGSACPAY